ncbi:MAG: gamma-glutamyl-gamma-aminobutyrate hydrolase family protein, partial [Gemmatimonadetes bacterium]|nr:gamma-glutamyl-gamma-aminobutyrate hydrolase family protein [Gemmatimonadota bacterium]
MPDPSDEGASRRVATTGDIEVATYLEIARGEAGAKPEAPPRTDEAIVVLDLGSQYSRLIARRVREAHVYCEIVPHTAGAEVLDHLNVRGIILSGGPASVYEPDAPMAPGWVFSAGVPVLGICYGMQLLAHQLGGKVAPGLAREYGYAVIHRETADDPLLAGLDETIPV